DCIHSKLRPYTAHVDGLATVTLDEMGLEPRQDHYKWELLGKETIKRGKLEWGKNVTNHTDTPLI
ncbi:hypothetical protein ACKI1Z_41240, partial [Streptomyces galilaeus]|uniref:hypothetical protein n=1 Tax=Streptomyces galilaeus TaxID=33899 RepID=UPI0038F744C5